MSEQPTETRTPPQVPVIHARGLTRCYGDRAVVDGIDLDIARGEVFGLLGPNGAGKTTTILMMLGLTEISSGEMSVLGFNPAREPLKVKRRVGYLPDAVGFYDQLTATENLAYTGKLMGLARAERARRIEQALWRAGLTEVASKRVATFSRGMRQRLGLAEIIMKRAEIAVLDEPTSGLDPQATQEFLGMIGELKAEGITVLLSSHMLDQVQRICDRVSLFRAGHIVLMGAVPELAVKVLGAGFVVEVEAEGLGLARRLAMIPGVTHVETLSVNRFRMTAERDVRPDAARAVVAVDGSLRRLSVDEPSLEAIYTRYFQDLPAGGARHAA
ncbi:ABC transporter ATP-binding protein [Bradyrhizobium manausense]|uniref:ABC transporter ATP-binding protein n=1 Tax=Bradyrhizobium manausense TaxID=989370 RepID=A0A0R3DV70_9BRAD|nr:ABC transporter ATP-binding protein [Bradyrhizobium manausense]KRQ13690.1 ABC transporter ATP-binding protein [Bradyrhizobium manausense]